METVLEIEMENECPAVRGIICPKLLRLVVLNTSAYTCCEEGGEDE